MIRTSSKTRSWSSNCRAATRGVRLAGIVDNRVALPRNLRRLRHVAGENERGESFTTRRSGRRPRVKKSLASKPDTTAIFMTGLEAPSSSKDRRRISVSTDWRRPTACELHANRITTDVRQAQHFDQVRSRGGLVPATCARICRSARCSARTANRSRPAATRAVETCSTKETGANS